jgi:hypothetical protein
MPASINRRRPSISTNQALAPMSESGLRFVMSTVRMVLEEFKGRAAMLGKKVKKRVEQFE